MLENIIYTDIYKYTPLFCLFYNLNIAIQTYKTAKNKGGGIVK